MKIRQALLRLLRRNKSVSKFDYEDLRSSVFSTSNNEWNTNFAFWNEDYTHQKDYNVKLWIDEYLLLSPLMPLWRVINWALNSSINSFWYCTSQYIYGYSFLLCLHIFTNLHLPITISNGPCRFIENMMLEIVLGIQCNQKFLSVDTVANLWYLWLKFSVQNIWNIENILRKKSTSNLFCCRMWQAVNFPFAILTRGQSAEFHEPWI